MASIVLSTGCVKHLHQLSWHNWIGETFGYIEDKDEIKRRNNWWNLKTPVSIKGTGVFVWK